MWNLRRRLKAYKVKASRSSKNIGFEVTTWLLDYAPEWSKNMGCFAANGEGNSSPPKNTTWSQEHPKKTLPKLVVKSYFWKLATDITYVILCICTHIYIYIYRSKSHKSCLYKCLINRDNTHVQPHRSNPAVAALALETLGLMVDGDG